MVLCSCRSGVPDGQPKFLLSLIPEYPLLNFMLTTSIYVAVSFSFAFLFYMNSTSLGGEIDREIDQLTYCSLQVSYRFFQLTNTLKSTFIPSKDIKRLGYNMVAAIVLATCLYTLSFVLLRIPPMMVKCCYFLIMLYFHAFILSWSLSCCPFSTND